MAFEVEPAAVARVTVESSKVVEPLGALPLAQGWDVMAAWTKTLPQDHGPIATVHDVAHWAAMSEMNFEAYFLGIWKKLKEPLVKGMAVAAENALKGCPESLWGKAVAPNDANDCECDDYVERHLKA